MNYYHFVKAPTGYDVLIETRSNTKKGAIKRFLKNLNILGDYKINWERFAGKGYITVKVTKHKRKGSK